MQGAGLIAALLSTTTASAQLETLTCRQPGTAALGWLNGIFVWPENDVVGDLAVPVRHGNNLYMYMNDSYGEDYYGADNDDLSAFTSQLTPPMLAPTLTWENSPMGAQSDLGALYMGWGRTVQGAFSTRGSGASGDRWVTFHRGLAWATCNNDSDCDEGLTCDKRMGTYDTPMLAFAFGVKDVCYRPETPQDPGSTGQANGMVCSLTSPPNVNGPPCDIICGNVLDAFGTHHAWDSEMNVWRDGVCRDTTSSMASSTLSEAHKRVESSAVRIEIGRDVNANNNVTNTITWITNKFINHTMMAVRTFDPANPAASDFRPPDGGNANNVHVLFWGRPNYVGNTAHNARAKLYFGYNRNPDIFGWDPRYFCGGTVAAPVFCDDQDDAIAIEQGDENYVNHFSVAFNQTLNKFVMLYGGNLPKEVSDLIHTNHLSGPSPSASERLYYKTASMPWGTWSSKTTIYDSASDPNANKKFYDPNGPGWPSAMPAYQLTPGQEESRGRLYSAHIVEPWSDGAPASGQVLTDLYFAVSTWNPYGVMLWKARIGTGETKSRTSAFYSNWYPHGFTMDAGAWSGGGDRVTMTDNANVQRAIFNGYTYSTDYRFDVDIYPADDDTIGLYARYTNASNHYVMWTKKQDGNNQTGIYRVKNGVTTYLGGFSWTYTQNSWDRWGIEVDGSTIRAYINGTLMRTLHDDQLPTGYAGLYGANHQGGRFDNMEIVACK